MVKIRVGVLTGGASAERDISLATGAQIAASLDPSRFEVVLLDPLAFMARNPEITAERREQAQRLIAGGGRLETDHQLPRGLEKQIESIEHQIDDLAEHLVERGGGIVGCRCHGLLQSVSEREVLVNGAHRC